MFGTIAISPLGSGLYCRTQRDLITAAGFDKSWTILADYDVYGMDLKKQLEYQDWNVKVESGEENVNVTVLFHRYSPNTDSSYNCSYNNDMGFSRVLLYVEHLLM